jgi:hypothetical protein
VPAGSTNWSAIWCRRAARCCSASARASASAASSRALRLDLTVVSYPGRSPSAAHHADDDGSCPAADNPQAPE